MHEENNAEDRLRAGGFDVAVRGDLQQAQASREQEPGATARSTIAALQKQTADDRQTIAELEEQGVVDRDIIADLQREHAGDVETIAQLEAALVTSRRIGTAIGILMAMHKITDEAAFAMLVQASQASNRKLRDIADGVVDTGTIE